MRPKKTYMKDRKIRRQPQYMAWWEGDYAEKGDAELCPELAAIINEFRASYKQKRTPAGDVKETLQGLRGLLDDADIQQAVHMMDELTKADLCAAAGRVWRKENPDPETLAPDDLFSLKSWPASRIRRMASEALKALRAKRDTSSDSDRLGKRLRIALSRHYIFGDDMAPEHREALFQDALQDLPKGKGRHSTQQRDVEFAAALAAYWQKEKGKAATIALATAVRKESAFVTFALDCFHRAGRCISAEALVEMLRKGCKIANGAPPSTT